MKNLEMQQESEAFFCGNSMFLIPFLFSKRLAPFVGTKCINFGTAVGRIHSLPCEDIRVNAKKLQMNISSSAAFRLLMQTAAEGLDTLGRLLLQKDIMMKFMTGCTAARIRFISGLPIVPSPCCGRCFIQLSINR